MVQGCIWWPKTCGRIFRSFVKTFDDLLTEISKPTFKQDFTQGANTCSMDHAQQSNKRFVKPSHVSSTKLMIKNSFD